MMSQRSRRELLAVVAPRYRAAHGSDRKRILDEFVESSGYHRKYALHLLNHPPKAPAARKKRQRVSSYTPAVQRALITCWRATNGICSKRLVPYLPELVAVLEQHGELQLDAQTKMQLLTLSPATADRLLRAERQHDRPHGLGTTKPGTVLKHQIPIRTFADWDDAVPGFVEVDLVAHCAESTHGEYLHSLTVTDIVTGWTECLALRNRSQHTVHAAIVQARMWSRRTGRLCDNWWAMIVTKTSLLATLWQHCMRWCVSTPTSSNESHETAKQRASWQHRQKDV
jgi:hypothetical protein